MDRRELVWRTRTTAQTVCQRLRSSVITPRWDRRELLTHLARTPALDLARTALRERRWQDAHRALSIHFATRPARFVIAPAFRATVRDRVCSEFPDSARNAAARGDRVLDGDYDLLGYRGLRFDWAAQLSTTEATEDAEGKSCAVQDPLPRVLRVHRGEGPLQAAIDWHLDPVHGRRAPRLFWADVPYLDPACGDHKIIWELNRHQHWLALGRAFWLTGDVRYRDRCLSELASWMGANPPLIGVNWASMLELALRSLSWIWALHFFAENPTSAELVEADLRVGPDTGATAAWTVDLLLGLDRQLTHVEHNLSHYFSPNTHLLGEALALYVAGRVLPELARSPRWESIGRQVLIAESERQIAADGGHCERSTHYHRYALDFYLLALAVARITEDPAEPLFGRAAGKLAAAARILADDDGRAAHIGDDDGGVLMPIAGRAADDWRDSLASAAALLGQPGLRVGPTPEEPFWLLAHPALARALDASRHAPTADVVASAALPDTGYFVSRSPAGDHLVVDGGPHGYQNGGHAHADALSLAFTMRGLPLLIDSGTGCYTIDADLRDRLRSTALHNTLVLDGRDQSTPRGPFHWATTANGTVRRWRMNGGFDYFDGAHDGYRPLEHRRHVLVLHGDLLIVADLVSEPDLRRVEPHVAAVHWHVDPRWQVETAADGAQLT
ncbi:MAG TPA: alginate lyase family protein, partial [Vicinamibacterales bacterium]|nr:alginate lyase family protein [Vicinamibacterales bacterium]